MNLCCPRCGWGKYEDGDFAITLNVVLNTRLDRIGRVYGPRDRCIFHKDQSLGDFLFEKEDIISVLCLRCWKEGTVEEFEASEFKLP